MEQIADHAARAVASLAWQFADATRLRQLATIVGARVQTLENVAFQVMAARGIDAAAGDVLDLVGSIVGQGRTLGWSDATMRAAVRARMRRNRTRGRVSDLQAVARLIATSAHAWASEFHPAAFHVTVTPPVLPMPSDDAANLVEFVRGTRGAAIEQAVVVASGHPFGFFGDPTAFGLDDGELSTVL